ncbi:MAG: bifunctional helix-turn-helix transcriptional regulator/GNAT family N-acetyltransferase [Nannocystaceae bacterium]|nr:bifunctional helix-turn-helix transcriptional regulator/GNAT family N-acetyltransferase [Nannocystaceae bacterium]
MMRSATDADILRDLGYLALGSRLKRLAEHLQADAAKAHARMGYPMKPAQFPLLAALDARGPLTVTEAVDALGISQPAVTRTLGSLIAADLVETLRDASDSRLKRIRLTPEGHALLARMKRDLWPHVDAAAAALAEGPPADLLTLLSRVEDAMQVSSLQARVRARTPPLRVVPYDDSLAETFAEITREWVEGMFALEANDKAIIEDPRGMIIDRGGEILFVEADGLGIVGTCALMPSDGTSFELTKMGVTASARGKKVGAFLLEAVLSRAGEMKASGRLGALFLLTNAKCEAAIHLYEKHGFVHDAAVLERFGPRYNRCDVAMSYPQFGA